MNSTYRLTTFEKSLAIGLIFSILFSIVYFQTTCDKISNKVFRLHVIANSDSREDQELKLKVRDRILEEFGNKELHSLESVKNFAHDNIDNLKKHACDEIIKNGFNYNVNVFVCKSEFNIRRYDNITLPAGNYDSLKIIIGEGKGKNWWCVLFPPICLGCSENHENKLSTFSHDEKNIVENEREYEIQFKVIEIIQSIRILLQKFIDNLVLFINK